MQQRKTKQAKGKLSITLDQAILRGLEASTSFGWSKSGLINYILAMYFQSFIENLELYGEAEAKGGKKYA